MLCRFGVDLYLLRFGQIFIILTTTIHKLCNITINYHTLTIN
jgi:hypothetical protein